MVVGWDKVARLMVGRRKPDNCRFTLTVKSPFAATDGPPKYRFADPLRRYPATLRQRPPAKCAQWSVSGRTDLLPHKYQQLILSRGQFLGIDAAISAVTADPSFNDRNICVGDVVFIPEHDDIRPPLGECRGHRYQQAVAGPEDADQVALGVEGIQGQMIEVAGQGRVRTGTLSYPTPQGGMLPHVGGCRHRSIEQAA